MVPRGLFPKQLQPMEGSDTEGGTMRGQKVNCQVFQPRPCGGEGEGNQTREKKGGPTSSWVVGKKTPTVCGRAKDQWGHPKTRKDGVGEKKNTVPGTLVLGGKGPRTKKKRNRK